MEKHKQENENVIYEANKEFVEMVKKAREKCHSICSGHFYRPVRVETVHGETYEGRIVNIDNHCLYLEVTHDTRQFPFFSPFGFNPYYSTILPLVLFDLLTISLLF